jgi:hypothetical protein
MDEQCFRFVDHEDAGNRIICGKGRLSRIDNGVKNFAIELTISIPDEKAIVSFQIRAASCHHWTFRPQQLMSAQV